MVRETEKKHTYWPYINVRERKNSMFNIGEANFKTRLSRYILKRSFMLFM